MSIFSGLNNLDNIALSPSAYTLLGTCIQSEVNSSHGLIAALLPGARY